MQLRSLPSKLSDYAGELFFAAQAPVTFRESLQLAQRTLAFHYRNWRGAAVDPKPRMALGLNHDGYAMSINLRPHDGDLAILYEIFARHSYRIPEALLDPASVNTILDLGANIGFASLYFAAHYPHAKIISVEPNPDNFSLLKANTASEPRIHPVQGCVTAVPQAEVFIGTTGRGSHYQMNNAGRGASVRGITIAELCQANGIDHVDLVKIDIEGAEQQIFAEGTFLPRMGLIVAELHGPYTVDHFNHDVSRWGFRARLSEFSPDPNIALAVRS